MATPTDLLFFTMDLTSAEFWTIVSGVVALLLFLGTLLVWGIRRASAVWRRPVVLIHYWWETVLEHDKRVLSPFLTVGTLRPVGDLLRKGTEYRKLAGRRKDIIERNDLDDHFESDWLLLPGYQLGTRHAHINGIKVLRVVVHNGSRNKVVSPEDLGFVRFEVETYARHVHGWRYGRLGGDVSSETMERGLLGVHGDWEDAKVEISLPYPLSPEESVRDDLTVSVRGYGAEQDPGVKVETTSDMRMRIKPWKPSRSREWWQIPSRSIRWIRNARKPRAYARR